jgi:hypothetical protein
LLIHKPEDIGDIASLELAVKASLHRFLIIGFGFMPTKCFIEEKTRNGNLKHVGYLFSLVKARRKLLT